MSEVMSYAEPLKFGWGRFKQYWKLILAFGALLWGINIVFSLIGNGVQEVSSSLGVVYQIFLMVVSLVINVVSILFILRIVDAEAGVQGVVKELENLKTATMQKMPHLINFVVGGILYGLLVMLGFILLVIPGIYWAIKYQFVMYLIIDQGLGVKEAFGRSGEMTQGKKMWLFLFGIIAGLFALLGLIAFIVGIVVTSMIVTIAMGYVYRRLSGAEPVVQLPKTTSAV